MLIGKSQNVNGKIIVIGDTNYACSYVTKNEKRPFAAWDWVISDDADTTVSPTTCAYDRIITNFVYSQAGIYTNITKDMSDHYLVWVKI